MTPDTRSGPSDTKQFGNTVPAESSGATLSSTVNSILPSGDDIKAQLEQAKEKIKVLTSQVEDQGLRQRKGDGISQSSSERSGTGAGGAGVAQQASDGVPVQMVAALCLLSFLLAYFFF